MSIGELKAGAGYLVRGGRLVLGMLQRRPIHCIVQVSNRCNLSCGFCSFWERPAARSDEMTVEDFEVISGKLAEAGSLVISIEGGEPLLRPDIVEIVRAFARHHHPILFTNGWTVDESLARALWDAGLSEIGVSIDYADPARHDAHRGRKGSHEAARRALSILRRTAPHGRRQVAVMTVVMHGNVDDMEQLLQLSAELEVNHQITLISTGGDGRQRGGYALPAAGAGERLLELKRRHPHFVAFSGYLEGVAGYLRGEAATGCSAGRRFVNIDHMGEVSPCIEKLHRRAGNLRREPWSVVYERLCAMEDLARCSDCYTSCRGFVDEMSGRPKLRSWREFLGDFATTSTASEAPAAGSATRRRRAGAAARPRSG